MDDTDKLIAWLRVQIDDDESGARAAFSGQADPENGWGESRTPGYAGVTITPHVGHVHEDVQAAHVVRWNPARVLREVEAKRKIVNLHTPCTDEPECWVCGPYGDSGAFLTLCLLALPYADRPGYQESWRP